MTLDQGTLGLLNKLRVRGDDLLSQIHALNGPAPEMVRVENYVVPTVATAICVLVPTARPRAVMIWYHGWSADDHVTDGCATIGRKLAERTGCVVVLAGCNREAAGIFPNLVEESSTVLVWVADHVVQMTGRAVPIIVAGQGTGGNLATVVALNARRHGGPRIALQVLVCPVTDAVLDRPSYRHPDNQASLTHAALARQWNAYVPDVTQRSNADASPLRAGQDELASLPATVILTATNDPLRDEGELYADALAEAGVQVDRHLYTGQMHGFFTALMLPGSERGFQQVVRAVRALLAHESHRAPLAAPGSTMPEMSQC